MKNVTKMKFVEREKEEKNKKPKHSNSATRDTPPAPVIEPENTFMVAYALVKRAVGIRNCIIQQR